MSESVLPRLEEVFNLVRDDRGSPCGVQPVEEKLDAAAKEAEPGSILAALESTQDPASAVVAVFLGVRLAKDAPDLAARIEKALLRLVSDLRTAEASFEGATQAFDLAACAFGAFFDLIRKRPPDLVAILGVLGSSLVSTRRSDLTAAAVHQFNLLFKDDPRYAQAADQVAELLADAVADAALSAATRIRAYEAIVCGARFSLTGRKPHPVAAAVFEKARGRAAEALVEALEKGPAKPELREYVLCNLDTIRPEAVGTLQEKGIILLGAIPPLNGLVSFDWLAVDPVKAARAALALKPEQVTEVLTKRDEEDPGLLSAVVVSSHFCRRTDWRPIAESLLRLAACDRAFEARSGDRAVPVHLGREAAWALLTLLRGAPAEREAEVLDWLFKGLEACLAKGLNASWCPLAPVMDFLFELNSRESETGGRLKKTMQGFLTVPSRPAKTRITAFCTYRNINSEADAWAQAALVNPKEDPEFVGLLRSLIVNR
ncbi:MAG: hypothetical protein HY748_00655 [Elusimicrobia bacterium]|nr:hypothetical protein [Elusimicrobiota bacterium]